MSSQHAPGRSYIKAAEPVEPVTPEITRLLARLAGLSVPEEDVALLTGAIGSQLAAISALDKIDLTDVNPAVEFDASW